ncbi:MAG: CRISPR-associated protein Cas5, partial [Bacteroidota bacterium]
MIDGFTFDISGALAHFRKFYGTNTAMSYGVPPRTTLMGIIAARAGLKKESYHEIFHSDHLRLGVALLTPLRKRFQRVNNLKIKGGSDFRGRKGRQQTPLELVSATSFPEEDISYRVYVAPGMSGDHHGFMISRESFFNPPPSSYATCLGAAFCLARIHDIKTTQFDEVTAGS